MAQWGNKKTSVNVTPTSTSETTEGAPIGVWALVNKGGGPNAHFGNTSGTRARTDMDMYTSNDFNQFVNNMAVGVYGFTPGDTKLPGRVDDIVIEDQRGSLYDPRNGYEPRMNIVMANNYVNREWAYATIADSYYVFDVPGQAQRIDTNSQYLEDVNEGAAIWGDESPKRPVYANSTSIVRGNANNGTFGGFRFTNLGYTVAQFAGIGNRFYYAVPLGETPIAPLQANTWYRVAAIENGDTIVVGNPFPSSDKIRISDFRANITAPAPTHYINGENFAFRVVFTPGAKIKSSHPGWNLRKEGKGGRTNRVQYECLVAMGTISNN